MSSPLISGGGLKECCEIKVLTILSSDMTERRREMLARNLNLLSASSFVEKKQKPENNFHVVSRSQTNST